MKKAVSIVLTVTMLAAVLAGCGSKAPQETTAAPTLAPTEAMTEAATEVATEAATEQTQAAAPAEGASAEALTILETVRAAFGENEKFPIMGGDPENATMDAPGAVPADKLSSLNYTLLIPEAQIANVDGAATMIHMMNANTFTSGVVHMTEGVDLTAFASEMKDTIIGNPFMCGFPERILIALVNQEYVLISYGNAQMLDVFQNHLTTAYPDAQVLHTDSLV